MHYIKEVENGANCNCKCPECNSKLIARNNPNNQREAHFSHPKNSKCTGGIESALHMLAKQVFLETMVLKLPQTHGGEVRSDTKSEFKPGQEVRFDKVVLEDSKNVNNEEFRPDAIGYLDGKELYVEFTVTSFIKDKKKQIIERNGIPCIEVNLKGFQLNENRLKNLLFSSTPRIYWIYHPEFETILNNPKTEPGNDVPNIEESQKKKDSKKLKQPKTLNPNRAPDELSEEEYERIRKETLRRAGWMENPHSLR